MTAPTHVPVAGLLVPVELVPRIITAIRATYPTLTDGRDDDAAVRAVLKHWIETTLATYEGAIAEAPVVEAVEQARTEYAARAEAARQKAVDDSAAITEQGLSSP